MRHKQEMVADVDKMAIELKSSSMHVLVSVEGPYRADIMVDRTLRYSM